MTRDVGRPRLLIKHYPGYPPLNARRLYGPYTVLDLGSVKQVWRHGWRIMDDGVEVIDEARNVCRRLRDAQRLPA